jgi:hypothetical protein
MSAHRAILLQNSTPNGSQAKIGNSRIGTRRFLNQHCALALDLGSMLLTGTVKLVLQQNPSMSGPIAACSYRRF